MEVGSTIWCGIDGMVLNIHHLRVTLRAQCLRRDESTSMPELLLNEKKEERKNKYSHEVEGDAPLNLALELMRDNPSK